LRFLASSSFNSTLARHFFGWHFQLDLRELLLYFDTTWPRGETVSIVFVVVFGCKKSSDDYSNPKRKLAR